MRTTSIVLGLVLVAAVGLSTFGYFAWRTVTLERVDPSQALRDFAVVRDALGPAEPMLRVDDSGQVVRGRPHAAVDGQRPSKLRALAYQASEQRLAQASVPFWFLKLKGPAIQFVLRGTSIDLEKLGVTVADLENQGPGLVLDETSPNRDRLLVWTE